MATADLLPGRTALPMAYDRSRRTWFNPGWQIGALLVAYPVWWVVGVTQIVPVVVAVPLARQLGRRGRVRVPSGFWIWLLFLLWVLVSVVALNVTVPGTLPPAGFGRYLSFAFRLLDYVALTVMMLYVGNMTEPELPRRRVIYWLTGLGLWVIALGLLAVLFPNFQTHTVLSHVLPASLLGSDGGLVRLAQVQQVLGDSPRPAAPFMFTNAWGNSLSLLLVWIVVAALVLRKTRRARVLLAAVLLVALVPIVFSLNRGMWIGLGLSIGVVGIRQAVRGQIAVLGGMFALVAAVTALLAFSPLSTIISSRLDNGNSNDIRVSLAHDSLVAATTSPVIGFGSTRATVGSDASIAIGQSPDCPNCGNRNIGSTGQLWLILIAQGVVGAGLYLGFFARVLWRYRHDTSAIGIAATLVVGLEMFYSLFYTALIIPLTITLISISLAWRNDQYRSRVSSQRSGKRPS